MALKNNTWKLNQWYDQDVAGNVDYSGAQPLFMAGRNIYGNLGLNDRTNRSSPTQVPANTWKTICVPSDFRGTHATKTDGTLWSWGRAFNGSLGDGANTNRSSPVQIGSDAWIKLPDHLAVSWQGMAIK